MWARSQISQGRQKLENNGEALAKKKEIAAALGLLCNSKQTRFQQDGFDEQIQANSGLNALLSPAIWLEKIAEYAIEMIETLKSR